MQAPRSVTIEEAARLTGLTTSAIRGRIHRGTLSAERIGSRVYVDVAALHDRRLIPAPSPGATVSDLLDRLERQAERIGQVEGELERLRALLSRREDE